MIRSRIARTLIAGALLIGLAVTWMSSYAQAGDITYGQSVNGTLKSGAQDTWHFLGNAGDLVNIAVTPTSGDLQPLLTIQDSTGQTIAGTQAAGSQGSATLKTRLPQGGSYLIQVAANGKSAGDYTLALTLISSGATTPTPQATAVRD